MSPPVLIVSEQLNYTKLDGIHAIFMPVIIEFSRCICTYSSAKFELKKYICGNPGYLRKQQSGCVFGYGGVGKTALVLEVVKSIVQDIWDQCSLNEYEPEYIFFFSAKTSKLDISSTNGKFIEQTIRRHFETGANFG